MQQQIQQAVNSLQQGQYQQAVNLSVSIKDKHPMAMMIHAIAQGKLGNTDVAFRELSQLHKQYPQNIDVLFNHGLLLKENGQLEAARQKLSQCIAIQSGYHPALHALGNIALAHKALDEAETDFQRAYSMQPSNTVYLCSYADVLCAVGKAAKAVSLFSQVHKLSGKPLSCFLKACYLCADRDSAKPAMRSANALNSGDNDTHFYAGLLETDEKRYQMALAHFGRCKVANLSEDDQEAIRLNTRYCEFMYQPQADSLQEFVASVQQVSSQSGLQYSIRILDRIGQLEKAASQLETYKSLFGEDEFYLLHAGIVCRRRRQYEQADELLNRYEHEVGTTSVMLLERAKLSDELGEYNLAADAVNALLNQHQYKPSPAIHYPQLDNLTMRNIPTTVRRFNLLAIVGFPRSGTTLLETRLSKHLNAFVLEETRMSGDFFAQLAQTLATPLNNLAAAINAMDDDTWTQWRSEFIEYAQSYGMFDPDSELLIDKMPLNHTVLPAYLQLFPELTIIQCTRNPADVFVSCLMHDEVNVHSVNEFAQAYQPINDFWKRLSAQYPESCMTINYEDFVTRESHVLQQIKATLALAPSEKNDRIRLVNSPSYSQTDQPLYTRSIARHHHYAGLFADFPQGLEELL